MMNVNLCILFFSDAVISVEFILPNNEYISQVHIGNFVVKSSIMPAHGNIYLRFGYSGSKNEVEEVIEII